MSETDQEPGVIESAKGIGGTVLESVHSRIRLFGLELQEEKLRAVRLLLVASVAIAIGFGGILVAMATLALVAWDFAGYTGLIVLTFLALGTSTALLLNLRRRLQAEPLPFSDSTAEFEKDLEWLRKKD